jgi:hypothetical protein
MKQSAAKEKRGQIGATIELCTPIAALSTQPTVITGRTFC